jgi:ABC-type Fe3+-hydroxamate transport system substrate-binding protein
MGGTMNTKTITVTAAIAAAIALTGCGSTPAKTPAAQTTPAATVTMSIADLTGQGLGVQGPPPGVAAPAR